MVVSVVDVGKMGNSNAVPIGLHRIISSAHSADR